MGLIKCPECENEVSSSAVMCPKCGYGVKQHFDNIRREEIDKIRRCENAKRKAKLVKYLKIWLPISSVVLIILVSCIANAVILSGRTTFKSNEEMLEYLSGSPSWKLDNDYTDEWLVINRRGFCERVEESTFGGGDIAKLSPRRGMFTTDSGIYKYVILDTGDVVRYNREYGDKYYKKSLYPPTYEYGSQCLKLEIINTVIDNGTIESEIKVTNTGKKTYQFIELNGIFYDEAKNEYKTGVRDSTILNVVEAENEKDGFSLLPGKSGICKYREEIGDFPAKSMSCYLSSYDIAYEE